MAETNAMVSKSAIDDPNLWATLAYTGGTPRLPDARPMGDPYYWNGQWVIGGGEDGNSPTPVSADWDPETRQMRSTGWINPWSGDGDDASGMVNPHGKLMANNFGQWIDQPWGGKGVWAEYDPTTQTYTLNRQAEDQGKYNWERADYNLVNGQLVRQGDWSPYVTQSKWTGFRDSGALGGLAVVLGAGALGSAMGLGGAAGEAAGVGAGIGGEVAPMSFEAMRAAELAGYSSAPGAAVTPAVAEGLGTVAANGVGNGLSKFLPQAAQLIKDNPQLAKLGVMGLAGALAGGAASGGDGMDMGGLTGLFAKSQQVADKQMALADKAYADSEAMWGEYAPLFKDIMSTSLAQSKNAGAMADKLYGQYTDLFMPANKKMVDTAMNYDTPERRAAARAAAGADVESAHALALEDANREMARAGIAPNMQASTITDLALAKARDRGAAATSAVRNVENTGIGLVSDAAKTGLNVAQLGNQTAQVGAGLADSAANTLTKQQALRLQGATVPAQLYGNAVTALNSAGNLYANQAQVQQNQQALKNQGLAGIGSLLGTVGTASKDSMIGKGLDWLLS